MQSSLCGKSVYAYRFHAKCCVSISACLSLQEAGYDEASCKLIENVMLGKEIPDPRDLRKYDLIGTLGMINYKILQVSQGDNVLAIMDISLCSSCTVCLF